MTVAMLSLLNIRNYKRRLRCWMSCNA